MIDIYLAVPYTDPDPEVRQRRFEAVTQYAAHLVLSGRVVYSPITYTHPMAILCPSLGIDWTHWRQLDMAFITLCHTLHILMMPGWATSIGVQAEIRLFKEAHKKIYYVEPLSSGEWCVSTE